MKKPFVVMDEFGRALNAAQFARTRLGFEPDARQEELLATPHRRVLLNCTRQWGKSTVTAVKAVHRAWYQPDSLVLAVSPSARQSGELLRKAEGFVRKLGVRPRGDGDNEISVKLPNGSRMVGLPGAEATVRGFSAVALLLIDEAARVEDDLYRAVLPMLAVSGGDLWLMSTPAGKRGFFWEEWAHGGPDWERVRVPATECPRIGAAFLEEQKRRMGERWYRQEYGCEFTDAEGALFPEELILRAVTDKVKPLF